MKKKTKNKAPITVEQLRELTERSLTEEQIYRGLVNHLKEFYPSLEGLWHFDRDLNYNPKLNFRHRKEMALYRDLNSVGFPDFTLAVPMYDDIGGIVFTALYLEIKTADKKVYKKDGTLYADEHLQAQAEIHQKLRETGKACCGFVLGLRSAIEAVDNYLKGLNPFAQ